MVFVANAYEHRVIGYVYFCLGYLKDGLKPAHPANHFGEI